MARTPATSPETIAIDESKTVAYLRWRTASGALGEGAPPAVLYYEVGAPPGDALEEGAPPGGALGVGAPRRGAPEEGRTWMLRAARCAREYGPGKTCGAEGLQRVRRSGCRAPVRMTGPDFDPTRRTRAKSEASRPCKRSSFWWWAAAPRVVSRRAKLPAPGSKRSSSSATRSWVQNASVPQ